MKKSLLYAVLALVQFTVARAFNIEVTVNSPLNISNVTANSNAVNATSYEPTFAGYKVAMSVDRDQINLIIGEPHYNRTANASSGSLLRCNFTYLKYVEMTTTTTDIMTTASSMNFTSSVLNNTATTSSFGMTSTKETSGGISATTMSTDRTSSTDFSELSCRRLNIQDKVERGREGDNHNLDTDFFGTVVTRNNDTSFAVCSPSRQQQCPNSYFVPGACYVGDPTKDEWNFLKWNETRCFSKRFAIIFVVDGSASITVSNFNLVRQWLVDVSNLLLQTLPDAVLIEVLQYSQAEAPFVSIDIADSTVFEIPFKFGECEDIQCITTGVYSMRYLSAQTFTYYALRRAREVELKNPVIGDADKIVVVLTDGDATDGINLPTWHTAAVADGITVFAVGVGSQIQRSELRIIANGGSTDDRVLTVNRFNELSDILNSLTTEISSGALEGGGSGSGTSTPLSNSQLGFSVDFGILNDTQNEFLLLGAPGAYDWSGAVTKYDSISDTSADIPTYEDVQGVLPNRTKESYMGYTVTTGFFKGSSEGEFAATGAPRYMLKGAVIVFKPEKNSAKFNQPHRIMADEKNSQLGSYFGGSLLAVDVNGDKKDDLLVGAPLYTGDNYDEGRVYVYVSKSGQGTLSTWASSSYSPLVLNGHKLQGGRFGTALASAGDLNKDGYNDVIIGAPLTEGDRGAVFVYHGNANGVDTTAKQRIMASELTGVNLKYFGQSIQGGVDLDGNLYPDVAVGAPKSDTVVIFRSRPVVAIEATVTFLQAKIDIFNCIDNNYVNCTSVSVCFTATGESIEQNIGLTYNLTLDSTKQSLGEKRLEFRDAQSPTGVTTDRRDLDLRRGVRTCVTRGVNMKANIKDYDSAVSVAVTFDLQSSHTAKPLSSIRDPTAPNTVSHSLEFDKNCGAGGQCQYDLQLSGSINLPPATLTTGLDLTNGGKILIISDQTSNNPVRVKLNLTNKGQNAFGTQVKVYYTTDLSWSRLENRKGVPATNSCIEAINQPVDIGNGMLLQLLQYNYRTSIMQQNSWCYFEITFLTRNLRNNGKLDTMTINVNALSSDTTNSSTEIKPADNSWNQTRPIKYRSDFTVEEQTTNTDIQFNFTDTEKVITSVKQIGENTSDVEINFKVKGSGYSNIPTVTMRLIWPSKTATNYSLLYLYSVACNTMYTTPNPEKGENLLSCDCEMDKVNIYNLTTDAPKENNTGGANVTTMPATVYLDQSKYSCFDNEGNHTCESMTCNIKNLGSSTEVNFIALFRLVTSTFNLSNTSTTDIRLISRFEAFETSPIILNKEGKNNNFTNLASREARKFKETVVEPQANNIWIYIVAAVGGLLLLIAIVAILWKVGFFKSKYADMKKDAQDDMDDAADFPGQNNGSSTADIMES